MKMKPIGRFAEVLPLAVMVFFSATCLWASPGDGSKDRDFIEETPLTQSVMGQALLRSDPKNPEGYRLLVKSQNAKAQWLDLLDTAGKAEQNGISDPFLYRQMAAAFWELRLLPQNFNTLMLAEVWAREYDK